MAIIRGRGAGETPPSSWQITTVSKSFFRVHIGNAKEKKRIGIKKSFSIEKDHIPVINLRQSQKIDKQNNCLSVPVRFFFTWTIRYTFFSLYWNLKHTSVCPIPLPSEVYVGLYSKRGSDGWRSIKEELL